MLNCANCPRLAAIRDHHNALARRVNELTADRERAQGVKSAVDVAAEHELAAFRADMAQGRAVAPASAYAAHDNDPTRVGARIRRTDNGLLGTVLYTLQEGSGRLTVVADWEWAGPNGPRFQAGVARALVEVAA